MVKVFWSPSDQDNNAVVGGGHEQMYALQRAAAGVAVLGAHDITSMISVAGMGDDSYGWLASVNEGNAWEHDIYIADHTNAVGPNSPKRSGVQVYCYIDDPLSVQLGNCIAKRLDPLLPGGATIHDGSHLGEVNSSKGTAVLTEAGYHDNPVDAAIIRSQSKALGEAIAYGIIDHLVLIGIVKETKQQEDIIMDVTFVDRNSQKPVTVEAGVAIGWLMDNLHEALNKIDILSRVVYGRAIPVVDEKGSVIEGHFTDLALEASWNPVNVARTMKANGFSDEDISRLLEAMAKSRVQVDIRVNQDPLV